jgi:hypothetical protein
MLMAQLVFNTNYQQKALGMDIRSDLFLHNHCCPDLKYANHTNFL